MIKYVRKAGLWCVTKITKNKDKTIQEQKWFDNLKEAKEAENEGTV